MFKTIYNFFTLDAVIKQQLSSLLFVKRVVDHRLHRLQEGVDTDSAGLPAVSIYSIVIARCFPLYYDKPVVNVVLFELEI